MNVQQQFCSNIEDETLKKFSFSLLFFLSHTKQLLCVKLAPWVIWTSVVSIRFVFRYFFFFLRTIEKKKFTYLPGERLNIIKYLHENVHHKRFMNSSILDVNIFHNNDKWHETQNGMTWIESVFFSPFKYFSFI